MSSLGGSLGELALFLRASGGLTTKST
ncbi:hypothetical protein A2U01_0116834, partial [Trifolium medium]|nr:hypothetical protein [Trifolium medium]